MEFRDLLEHAQWIVFAVGGFFGWVFAETKSLVRYYNKRCEMLQFLKGLSKPEKEFLLEMYAKGKHTQNYYEVSGRLNQSFLNSEVVTTFKKIAPPNLMATEVKVNAPYWRLLWLWVRKDDQARKILNGLKNG